MRSITFISVAFVLSGCGCGDDIACKREQESAAPTSYVTEVEPAKTEKLNVDKRISVTRIDAIADSLAYGGTRGVYVIKDNETGREYIGVSGVGISERGLHSQGKTSAPDER